MTTTCKCAIPLDFDVKEQSFLKILGLADNLTSEELVEFLFVRRRHNLALHYPFQKSYSMVTSDDLYFASRTIVKVLLNLILTIVYTCSAAPVITSRTLVTWTCNDF